MCKTRFGFFFVFVALMCASAFGQNNYKVIHSFKGPPNDASYVVSNVVFDKKGNTYGTSANGGLGSMGTVYELSPDGQGNWTETILYNFCQDYNGFTCLDGASPTAGMAMDANGNLYGIGFGGSGASGSGGGVLFELSPPAQSGGAWTESVLYNFCSDMQGDLCLDGLAPASQPVFDSSGNLYGTTAGGGTGHLKLGGGTVFELSPSASGWTEKILYSFCSQGTGDNCPDGEIPSGGVTFDKHGNLFGTTDYSGNVNMNTGGTLYELMSADGSWKYSTILSAPPNSAIYFPDSKISLDSAGDIYAVLGQKYGGVVQLSPSSHKRRIFEFTQVDEFGPTGGVYVDARKRSLYGNTAGGGANDEGNIYKIDEFGNENVLYSFCSQPNCVDGFIPWAILVPDAQGNLYGTTEFGGEYGAGVVFEITP